MLIKLNPIVSFFLAGILFSCEEEFQPKIDPTIQHLLVVDGMITNQSGPYTVKLSLSSSLENPQYIPLTGYHVQINDDQGDSEQLSEFLPGEYTSQADGIRGIPGRKYNLTLISPEGRQYASVFEELRVPAPIDSVYHQLEYQSEEGLPYEIAGYRFYVSSGVAPVDTTYFLWRLENTYKYVSDFKIYWKWEGALHPVFNHDSLRFCYKSTARPEIYVMHTANMSPPMITGLPMHFVSTETRDLAERYSLLVKQFSISKTAFKFWQVVKEQNTGLDDLYSKQPFQVKGNIINLDQPDETVLGYFMVAGVTEKRIFVNKPLFPVQMRYAICEFTEDVYRNFGALSEFPASSWPIFATRGPLGNALPNQWCMDCRLNGGVLEKPDFWID
ncbi:MAG: DUF4249 domain-containing protein [Bacteroidales bacterium]|nr:DUF4249 domain-containing protein [Bacteroidales bacterium]